MQKQMRLQLPSSKSAIKEICKKVKQYHSFYYIFWFGKYSYFSQKYITYASIYLLQLSLNVLIRIFKCLHFNFYMISMHRCNPLAMALSGRGTYVQSLVLSSK